MNLSWQNFANAAPELAAFGEKRFKAAPAYLATVRANGMPRVHPVTPIIAEGHLLLFMEPTSPKGHDLQRGSGYALHCTVADDSGGEGEFYLSRTRLSGSGSVAAGISCSVRVSAQRSLCAVRTDCRKRIFNNVSR